MKTAVVPRISFKAQMLKVREDAIVQSVNRLLAEKGFDAMTVDEVAAKVGIAKASLYKHFSSKEDLAAAAMVRVMRQAQEFFGALSAENSPLENLRHAVRWTMGVKQAGECRPCRVRTPVCAPLSWPTRTTWTA
jgi:TetR/AcrR family transcriptional regulator of autoinduction and epiphytic fitness